MYIEILFPAHKGILFLKAIGYTNYQRKQMIKKTKSEDENNNDKTTTTTLPKQNTTKQTKQNNQRKHNNNKTKKNRQICVNLSLHSLYTRSIPHGT